MNSLTKQGARRREMGKVVLFLSGLFVVIIILIMFAVFQSAHNTVIDYRCSGNMVEFDSPSTAAKAASSYIEYQLLPGISVSVRGQPYAGTERDCQTSFVIGISGNVVTSSLDERGNLPISRERFVCVLREQLASHLNTKVDPIVVDLQFGSWAPLGQ